MKLMFLQVVISGLPDYPTLPSQRSIFQRTSVLYGKREPEFQRHLKLPLPTAVYDHQILHISVWHRDKKCRYVPKQTKIMLYFLIVTLKGTQTIQDSLKINCSSRE